MFLVLRRDFGQRQVVWRVSGVFEAHFHTLLAKILHERMQVHVKVVFIMRVMPTLVLVMVRWEA